METMSAYDWPSKKCFSLEWKREWWYLTCDQQLAWWSMVGCQVYRWHIQTSGRHFNRILAVASYCMSIAAPVEYWASSVLIFRAAVWVLKPSLRWWRPHQRLHHVWLLSTEIRSYEFHWRSLFKRFVLHFKFSVTGTVTVL